MDSVIRILLLGAAFCLVWACDEGTPETGDADAGQMGGTVSPDAGPMTELDGAADVLVGPAGGTQGAGGAQGAGGGQGAGGDPDAGGEPGQGGASGAGGMGGGGQAACTSHTDFFVQTLWPQVIEPNCVGCHVDEGFAEDTRLTFLEREADDWAESGMAALTRVATAQVDGRSLLVLKPSGQTNHVGGAVIARNSPAYALLEEMAGRLDGTLDDCGRAPMGGMGPEFPRFDPGFRRLTREQFTRTLADLHGTYWMSRCGHPAFGEAGCDWPVTSAQWYERFTTQNWGYWGTFRSSYPSDSPVSSAGDPRGGFRRLDATVYGEHLNVWTGAVMGMATDNYQDWVGRHLVHTPCLWNNREGVTQFETDAEVDAHCIETFISEFGRRAYRRPLSPDEVGDYMDYAARVPMIYAEEGLDRNGRFARTIRDLVAMINLSPEFLYRVELPAEDGRLDAYELASRLSYHFWNTMPDDALFEAAAAGRLSDPDGYGAEVDRLFADPRTDRSIREFYEDYFRVRDLPDVNNQDGPTSHARVDYHTGPNRELSHVHWNSARGAGGFIVESMASELINLGRWFTQARPGTFEDMFRSNLHLMECTTRWDETCFGAGPWAQSTYEIAGNCENWADCFERGWVDVDIGWDGESEPIELPERERVGLLTRMSFLAHDTLAARPIRRGLKIREMLLCDPVPPPENCDVVKPPEVEGEDQVLMTVREKVEALTENAEDSCAQCHSTLINGFGHALGHFSSVGKYWETEHMFSDRRNAEGEFWWFVLPPEEWREIDTAGETVLQGRVVQFDGAQEAADVLVESGRMEWCWSREYFRFAMGRLEWASDDAAIEALSQTLRDGATLGSAFRGIALLPQFSHPYRRGDVLRGEDD